MPIDTSNDVETTATGLLDTVGAMMANAAEAVQDFAANVMAHDGDAEDTLSEDDADATDDDEDDMDDEDEDADEEADADADESAEA